LKRDALKNVRYVFKSFDCMDLIKGIYERNSECLK